MRGVLLSMLAGCGRLAFEPSAPAPLVDAAGVDGLDDGSVDGMPGDGPAARACHADVRYVGAVGLANTYREIPEVASWVDARTRCQADDADLWVVDSAAELAAFDGDWTGITDVLEEGVWRTLDGTLATFLPFEAGQPDGGSDENCLRTSSSGFEDRECSDVRDYVCECPAP